MILSTCQPTAPPCHPACLRSLLPLIRAALMLSHHRTLIRPPKWTVVQATMKSRGQPYSPALRITMLQDQCALEVLSVLGDSLWCISHLDEAAKKDSGAADQDEQPLPAVQPRLAIQQQERGCDGASDDLCMAAMFTTTPDLRLCARFSPAGEVCDALPRLEPRWGTNCLCMTHTWYPVSGVPGYKPVHEL